MLLCEPDHTDIDVCCICGRKMSVNDPHWPFCSTRCGIVAQLDDDYDSWTREMDRYYEEMHILGRS